MKPSLQLKISQQLTMTPQLQQAIRLLQLSTLDLQQEIQETVESNPLLELNEDHDGGEKQEANNNEDAGSQNPENGINQDPPPTENNSSDSINNTEFDEANIAEDQNWAEDIPQDLPVDSAWDDVYQQSTLPQGPAYQDGDLPDAAANTSASESIRDHLSWQLNLTPMSDTDRIIAISIIDAIDLDGYLNVPLESIITGVNSELATQQANTLNSEHGESVELDEVEAVLHRLQHFDPIGVCSRNLQECLTTQLNQFPEDTPLLNQARLVVEQYLPELGTRDFQLIMRRTRLKEPQLADIVHLIQSLNPRPGEAISGSTAEYVIPDVVVKKVNDLWHVELNPEALPKVRINATYAGLIRRADNSSDNIYLRNHLQEARWFLKSLQSRHDTLLKVSSKIVEVQSGFLDYGEEAMKPLVLQDIAKEVEMHESTISRVTTQKFIHTPKGIFELKYFFSSHVDTDTGGGCSSTAIRAIIKKLVAAEKTTKPLSDNKIAQILSDQGIQVARRTIAKYRESLSIPPSNERKRLV